MQDFKKGDDGLGLFKQVEPITVKAMDLKLPDPHEAARLAGMKDIDLKELESKEDEEARKNADAEREQAATEEERVEVEERAQQAKDARNEARKRRRVICFCGREECRIGAFTIVKED